MAARWGAGEETLTACSMEFFSLDTVDETTEMSSGETLEALQNCLDPSILSIFEDTPSIETKGLDEESEATLLTALTEILDNVDDENLSPFDTLPDSDLLSGQKGREHSPVSAQLSRITLQVPCSPVLGIPGLTPQLRRLLCLSRTPPEKDPLCNARPLSTGKSLPRIHTDSVQRSDGEEEEDGSLTLSPTSHSVTSDNSLLDWEGLTLPLPVTFEHESNEGLSVSLGDLVRHMHPYCMTICMENDEGEQMLPEGGILLEVVDQGENGEPILAIPDMDLPASLSLTEQSAETLQKMSAEAAEEVGSESSEHIVVDDEDDADVTPVAVPVTPNQCPDGKEEMITQGQKLDIKAKSPSRRKKKKNRECKSEPVESRVLRSASFKNPIQELPKKYENRMMKDEKKKKIPKDSLTPKPPIKPKKERQTETKAEITAATLTPETSVKCATSVLSKEDTLPLNVNPEGTQSSCPTTDIGPQQPDEMPQQMIPAESHNHATSVESGSPSAPFMTTMSEVTPSVSEPLPAVAPVAPEPKPKSLSLAEYRRLRQQKKLVPVEKQDDNSTKWPSLPELPKELPPIPCLPDPSPKDPRRPNPTTAKKEVEEVRPAWQPRGPCAPPTPEALLVPPAYMVASSSKAAAVPKPQQTQEPQAAKPQSPNPPVGTQSSIKTTVTTPLPAVPCVPQPMSMDGKCPTLSEDKGEGAGSPQPLPVTSKSGELRKTTTEAIKPTAATMPAPTSSQRATVSQKSCEVTAASSINNPCTSKPKITGTQPYPSQSAHPVAFQAQKPVSVEAKGKPTTVTRPSMAKSQTQELIESFTSEIGIEAADLTSLLEQFEETQAKEEQCVPEVSGRAAAVGNSSIELAPEKTIVERVRTNELSNTAALTPPATPPHQMWKPLAPVALLGKNKAAESKASPSKVIQIEARPLPSIKSHSKPAAAAATIAPDLACMDHDYCLPSKDASTVEAGKRWNVKQQTFITIKPIKHSAAHNPEASMSSPESSIHSATNPVVTSNMQEFPSLEPLDHRTDATEKTSVLETPDASPTWQENDAPVKEDSHKKGPFERSYRWHATSRSPSPACSTKKATESRGRKRRSHRSPTPSSSGSDSDSHSSRSRSRSHSPSTKRYRHRHSKSSSSSSSRSSSRSSRSLSRSPPRRRKYSYSSSRSGSWSRSRSRSRSPQRHAQWNRNGRLYSPSYRSGYSHSAKPKPEDVKRLKEKAIEERRVVYIGRIRGTMTQRELKDRFSYFGEIEECTLHFRDQGDNYGFVTYYSTKDAFTAIENGSKLRKPDELPFDLCFGGRRQFCKTSYSDLDSSRDYEPLPEKGRYNALDFDTLLKQAQQNLKR